ncbi:hypothetical protein GC176_13665 [bacterium]|nr:hypothetical protein [bacterium]
MESSTNADADTLIQKARELAQRLGKDSLSKVEFIRETGVSEWQIVKHFDYWNSLVEAAGLTPTDVGAIDETSLLVEMKRVFDDEGCVPTQQKFQKKCRHSLTTYRKRFGSGWNDMLYAFAEWLTNTGQSVDYADQLVQPESTPNEEQPNTTVSASGTTTWPSLGGRAYGPVLNFRGLQHAPVNEQGVVFLFGMLALELGFLVESVATGFPDCEAKRRISKTGNRWERVRIEFEFCSRNFVDHGHPVNGCDLIVCWEHNWGDCPLEVLELRSVLEALVP